MIGRSLRLTVSDPACRTSQYTDSEYCNSIQTVLNLGLTHRFSIRIMGRHVTKRDRLVDLMLVLAVVLASMQGAWSASGNLCQHSNDMTAAHHDCHLGNTATARSANAGDCCCHAEGQSGNPCSDSCQSAPVAQFQPEIHSRIELEYGEGCQVAITTD